MDSIGNSGNINSERQPQNSQMEALQNSAAFRHLQKQISKLRKHFLSEGYSPAEVTDMLQEVLLQRHNQQIDWRNLSNTNEFYEVMEKYSGTTSQVAESVLKFKNEISQIHSLPAATSIQLSSPPTIGTTLLSTTQNSGQLPTIDQSTQYNHNDPQNLSGQNQHISQTGIANVGKTTSDIDEISDRFLYRLEKKCCIEKQSSSDSSSSSSSSSGSSSSSSNSMSGSQNNSNNNSCTGSENGEHEPYQFKLNQNLIQSEIALDQRNAIPKQKQLKKHGKHGMKRNQSHSTQHQQEQQQVNGFAQMPENHSPTDQNPNYFPQQQKKIIIKQQKLRLGTGGGNSNSIIGNTNQSEIYASTQSGSGDQNILSMKKPTTSTTSVATSGMDIHAMSLNPFINKQSLQHLHQFFSDDCDFDMPQQHNKKQCRRQLDSMIHTHAGKKRSLRQQQQQQQNQQTQQQQMQQQGECHDIEIDFSAIEDMQLLERKFRYYTQNDHFSPPPPHPNHDTFDKHL